VGTGFGMGDNGKPYLVPLVTLPQLLTSVAIDTNDKNDVTETNDLTETKDRVGEYCIIVAFLVSR
jgi:hypothetical protein